MFQFNTVFLNDLSAKIQQMISDEYDKSGQNPQLKEYATSAVLANCIDNDYDLEQVANHVYAKMWGKLAEPLHALYDMLVEGGHDQNNRYEYGRCDRYCSYIASEHKAIFFCNQNISFVVALNQVDACDKNYTNACIVKSFHVRLITVGKNSYDPLRIDATQINENMLNGAAVRYDNTASDYFRYHDLRDRGYVVSLEADYLLQDDGTPFYKIERAFSANPHDRYILTELSFATDTDEE